MGVFPLLRLLANGEFHSGPALGGVLSLSRAAVWNQVRAIECLGLRVYKVRGRGYRLAEPLDLIDLRSLEQALSAASVPFAIELLDECASTNTVLLERARQGAAQGSVLVCEVQSAGRGRRGSEWHSGVGTGLTFSLAWRFHQGAGALSGLSLAVGVAIARAVESFGFDEVGLKWPNDLLLRGSKLGGILIEMSGDALGPSVVVIGVGLNVRLPQSLSARIDQFATGLEQGNVPSRTILLARALEELGAMLPEFARLGFEPFRGEWMRRHAWKGRRASLRIAGREAAAGEAVGVAEDGALLLRTARGVERFHSGELRLDADLRLEEK
jgi:BirA family biotin operon repressor/biotin-[acetyl-CoA-carboxylase] ligase